MLFSKKFISRNEKVSTYADPVPAPLMRRNLELKELPDAAELTVCGLGFYELFVNGERITRGRLSPYVTNPDQLLPYDTYDLKGRLVKGKNTLAFILGCGSQNAHTACWGLRDVLFTSAPKLAFALELTKNGECEVIEADGEVMTADSEIFFNDLRYGEDTDRRRERVGWSLPDYPDSDWDSAITVRTPNGEAMLATGDPIVETKRVKPVKIWREGESYIYDFGINGAGLTELKISGTAGQRIEIQHSDLLIDGKFTDKNLFSAPQRPEETPKQRTVYICRGDKEETHLPYFTYYGFRYAKVTGITEKQATKELLTYVCINSDLREIGDFECSDESLNLLYKMTKRATISNFHHFPTDCPQREKHGWTADASLSAEHTMLNYTPDKSYKMWLKAVCRAQNHVGALPGVVPTGGYGFAWGNGPAWDSVLTVLPYTLWILRGDLTAAKECGASFMRYVYYLKTRLDKNGLLAIGLGDWCEPKKERTVIPWRPQVDLHFTDSTYAYLVANMYAEMFNALGMKSEAEYCTAFAEQMRLAIRTHLLDKETMTFAKGEQTAQAMAIYYGLCDGEEEEKLAYERLLEAIEEAEGHMFCGVLGARVLFRVLTERGDADLAISMITRPDPPSYGVMIANGEYTLTEHTDHEFSSHNHHFWGDIAALMMEHFAGINIDYRNTGTPISLKPYFPASLSHAKASTETPSGKVAVSWQRSEDKIILSALCPDSGCGSIHLPDGYVFENGSRECPLVSGDYVIVRG